MFIAWSFKFKVVFLAYKYVTVDIQGGPKSKPQYSKHRPNSSNNGRFSKFFHQAYHNLQKICNKTVIKYPTLTLNASLHYLVKEASRSSLSISTTRKFAKRVKVTTRSQNDIVTFILSHHFVILYALICIHNTQGLRGRTTPVVRRHTTSYNVGRRRTTSDAQGRTRTLSHDAVRHQWVNDFYDVQQLSLHVWQIFSSSKSANLTSTLLGSRRAASSI